MVTYAPAIICFLAPCLQPKCGHARYFLVYTPATLKIALKDRRIVVEGARSKLQDRGPWSEEG